MTYLYSQNRKLLSNKEHTPIHAPEILENIYHQKNQTSKKLNIRQLAGFLLLLFIATLSCWSGIVTLLQAIDYIEGFVEFNIIEWIKAIGLIALSMFAIIIGMILYRRAFRLLFSITARQASNLADGLIQKHQIATGKVINVVSKPIKRIQYTYLNANNEEITAEFETISQAFIDTGDSVIVMYDENFSILL